MPWAQRVSSFVSAAILALCLVDLPRAIGAPDASATKPKDQLQVISAATLVGREIRDPQGARLGFVDYVLFDAASGAVRDVVIAPSSAKAGEFVGLTWAALRQPLPNPWEAMVATVPRAQLDALPRVTAAELFGTRRTDAPGAPKPTAQPTISDQDLEALAIKSSPDRAVAAVDGVVIDGAAGRIAYLLAAPFSETATAPGLTAVPFEGLRWSDQEGAYYVTLKGGLRHIDGLDPLIGGLSQRSIDRASLAALFDAYGTAPYWKAGP